MADTPAPPRVPAPQLTIRELADWLDPPLTQEQLTALIHVAGVKPGGTRRGKRGRPALAYDAAEIMRLHAAFFDAFGEWLLWASG